MQDTLEKISSRLGLTVAETTDIIAQALKDPEYQTKLVEILGYDMLDEAEAICRNRGYFVPPEEVLLKGFYVEHVLPESVPVDVDESELVGVDAVGKDMECFGYSTFNIIQSKVFHSVYECDDNVLICAPTGAGKTDIALLAVLRTLRKRLKVVYIAPMRALATEIASKYRRQLRSHRILEYTGDTEVEVERVVGSDVIVSTPEKFDVVTRKQYNIFRDKVGLVVIDEIHLLQDDRGPVIEAIVCRMFGYVETNQRPIRVVGLSATLPNYEDVAMFLKARCVFNFGQSYRPVPLRTSVCGIVRRGGSGEEELVKIKVDGYVDSGKQVLVFVHSRGETVRVAKMLASGPCKVDVKNKVLTGTLLDLFRQGIGVHHAGLPREIRLCMEDGFKSGCIGVLVTTSTLAWGVNLPAYAVVIKGTRYYDSSKGGFSDLSILDILQIFGRAGRPQFDSRGEACLITSGNKVSHYLSLLKNNRQVESRLLQHVADMVNAEVYLNTITDMSTAMTWLKGTFMYIRMFKNPLNYGLSREDLHNEDKALSDYVVLTCNRLEESGMVRIHKPSLGDHTAWRFCSTEYGRIGSVYYISHETMRMWLGNMDGVRSEDSVLGLCLLSREFGGITWREEEGEEISCICEELGLEYKPTDECKVFALAKAYIKGRHVSRFSLQCDVGYIVKNLRRVLMALGQALVVPSMFEAVRTCCTLLRKMERQKASVLGSDGVQVFLHRVGPMVKIQVATRSSGRCWMFVYMQDTIIYGNVFNQSFYSFLRTSSNVLRIEVVFEKTWTKVSKEYYVIEDNGLESVYHNGVHECGGLWSIVGDKTSCVHFKILDSLSDLVDEVSGQEAEDCERGQEPCRIVMTNKRIELFSDYDTNSSRLRNLHCNPCYKGKLSCVPGITISYLRPTIPSGFVGYILCDFTLRIRFIQIHCRAFRERQQLMNSSILSMVDGGSRPVVVVVPDAADMRTTAHNLRTRMFLSNMSLGLKEGVDVRCGVPQDGACGIFVTTFDNASDIPGSPLVILKGCSNLDGYLPVFEVLRICDRREALIYENPDYIEYLGGCVLGMNGDE